MTANKPKIAIIGGSGLDDPKLLKDGREIDVDTPWGKPSDKPIAGMIGGKEVIILSRHAKGHTIAPTKIPFRANIRALKDLGCSLIIATTACGSLREDMQPGELVLIDQFIDFTKLRPLTYYEDGVVHTPMVEPFDRNLRKKLAADARELGIVFHDKGTMVTIEGPRFSTKAESKMFQLMGADLINMSTVPEVTLANELKLPYQSIAMVTDYDCWKENEEPVSFELVMKRMEENAEKVKKLLVKTIENL